MTFDAENIDVPSVLSDLNLFEREDAKETPDIPRLEESNVIMDPIIAVHISE